MTGRLGDDVWYLLTLFNCFGYMVLFVVVLLWLRLMIHVVEDALAPIAKRPPRPVHPVAELPPTAHPLVTAGQRFR